MIPLDLDGAWKWYGTTRRQLQLFGRLGRNNWDGLRWDGSLGRDDAMKGLESDAIVADSEFCLEHIGDFAVLILFSAFETIVRDQVLSKLEDEKARIGNGDWLLSRFLKRPNPRGRDSETIR